MWGENWPGKRVGERSGNSPCHLAEVPRFPQHFTGVLGGEAGVASPCCEHKLGFQRGG